MSVPKNHLADSDALALADQISAWLKDKLEASGAERFVLALSGGIDSAVVCGLCARAVGPDKVLGVMMPSSSNPDDAEAAQDVADAFEIKSTTVDLTDLADLFYQSVPDSKTLWSEILGEDNAADGAEARTQLALANVRPRLRMITAYYLANLCRGIVVGTGNKSESMIGYFTKYGDGGVDLMPIVDLYKNEVRSVARVIGVPERVINRPPSAGLWQGQTDENEIGLTYEQLDATLDAMESGDTSGIEPEVLAKVMHMNKTSAHKREPVPAFSKSS